MVVNCGVKKIVIGWGRRVGIIWRYLCFLVLLILILFESNEYGVLFYLVLFFVLILCLYWYFNIFELFLLYVVGSGKFVIWINCVFSVLLGVLDF